MNRKLGLSPSTLSLGLFDVQIHPLCRRTVSDDSRVFSGACWCSSTVSLALYCSKADLVVLVLMSSMMFFKSLLKFPLLIVSDFLPDMERFVGIGFGQGISNVNAL